ncbi:MAG: heme-binding protein [Cyanobacteria bacterium SZAS-4]|nr:heme-binding protein [Cyanobacteria bacterium SZAS-4]
MTVNGSTVRAFYNPPWTLPFLRRNEIWIPFDLRETLPRP